MESVEYIGLVLDKLVEGALEVADLLENAFLYRRISAESDGVSMAFLGSPARCSGAM